MTILWEFYKKHPKPVSAYGAQSWAVLTHTLLPKPFTVLTLSTQRHFLDGVLTIASVQISLSSQRIDLFWISMY
jgi:hypothetical protein